jgi:hypothetical protein
MQLKEFSVGFSRTINMGNFESARVEAHVTLAVPETASIQNLADYQAFAQSELRKLLEMTWKQQQKKEPKNEQA